VSASNPQAPLVISTHDLGRAAGLRKQFSLIVPAPSSFGNAVIGLPEGLPIKLDLTLDSVVDGVLVTGVAALTYQGECARCLDPIEQSAEIEFQELYFYPDVAISAEDELFRMNGELIYLEPALRDAALLDLPLAPVCSEECLGLCAQCGVRLAENPNHVHEQVDSRWQALADLFDPKEG